MDLSELAGEAYAWFETRERDSENELGKTSYVTLKDGAPEWVKDMVYTAHGDMLPDDWRYEVIREAVGAIHDAGGSTEDLDHEFADYVDVYTRGLLNWLGSRLDRQGYCDEAVDEGLVSADASLTERIGIGQYMERREVFGLVMGALQDELESREEDEDE